MNTLHNTHPWPHWITDDFLTLACLAEVKSVKHAVTQENSGRRVGNGRLFITDKHADEYPHLHQLYCSLHDGNYLQFFEQHTGISYKNLYPRLEVISDIGDFYLEPHYDLKEKRLTALVYTDYEKLYPGTGLGNGTRVESRDNRCFFFVPGTHSLHDYPAIYFDKVRRCLQINYWTYNLPTESEYQTTRG
jgi:hypothetical protein